MKVDEILKSLDAIIHGTGCALEPRKQLTMGEVRGRLIALRDGLWIGGVTDTSRAYPVVSEFLSAACFGQAEGGVRIESPPGTLITIEVPPRP